MAAALRRAADELSASVSEIGRQVTRSTEVAQTAVTKVDHANATVQSLSEAAKKIGAAAKLMQQADRLQQEVGAFMAQARAA